MPQYTIRDPKTGRSIKVTGDSPPNEQEAEELFRSASTLDLNKPVTSSTAQAVRATTTPFGLSAEKRVQKLAAETGLGAAAGAATPEIMQFTGRLVGMIPTPLTRAAGAALTGIGIAAKPARAALAVQGAIGGGAGEFAAQESELAGQGKLAQEAWRLSAGVVTPYFGQAMWSVARGALSLFAGGRAGELAGAAGQDLGRAISDRAGIPYESLSKAQRDYVNGIADDIRRGTAPNAREELFTRLQSSVDDTIRMNSSRIADLERQADDILRAGAAAAGQKTTEAAQRAEAITRQLNERGASLRAAGESRAREIKRAALDQANQIRAKAQQAGPEARQAAEAQAQKLLDEENLKADLLLSDAQAQANRAREVAAKMQSRATQSLREGRAPLTQVGAAQAPSEAGSNIRNAVAARYQKLREVREQQVKANKSDAFTSALAREQSGERVKNLPTFAALEKSIDDALTAPTTGLVNVSVPQMRTQLQSIRKALRPTRKVTTEDGKTMEVADDISFEALENLRRFLRDRSFGLPAEGFDAIGQQQAKDLAKGIESVMEQFSPKVRNYIDGYAQASEPLRAFRTQLGESVLKTSKVDKNRFVVDEAALAGRFFKSQRSVDDLRTMLGDDADKAEQIARNWVADQLQNADSAAVRTKLTEWRDWLPSFPRLKQELDNAAASMQRGETFASARSRVAAGERQTARRITEQMPDLEARAKDIVQKAARKADELRAQGMTREADILTAAAKEADSFVRAGDKQAAQALNAVEQQITAATRAGTRQATRITREGAVAARAETRAAREAERQPAAEAKQLSKESAALRDLVLADKATNAGVRQIILSNDRRLWQAVAPRVNADPTTKKMFGDSVRQVVAETARNSPRNMNRLWDESLREFLTTQGLMSPAEVQRLDAQLQAIQRAVDVPETRKLSAMNLAIIRAVNTLATTPVRETYQAGLEREKKPK